MIEIKGLSHQIDKNIILKGIDLTVNDGCIMGLVGINGAGKTTLLRLCAGIYTPTAGEIIYDGKLSPKSEAARQNIFFLPDDPYYTAAATPKSMFAMYKRFYPNIDREYFRAFLSENGLDEKKPLRNFSKGMRRQMYVGLALSVRPKYLFLDEAFDGLDPIARKKVRNTLNSYVDENDATVIISSHALRELEDFCDMFALINQNTISSSGDIAEKVSSLCRFRLAFADGAPTEKLLALPHVSLEIEGKFVSVTMEGDSEECEKLLLSLSPTVMDEMQMNFEEAFIHDIEKEGEDEQ